MTDIFNRIVSQYQNSSNEIRNKWVELSKEYFSSFVNANEVLSQFKNDITIIMHGSTTRNIEDNYSDLDYWLILTKDEYEKYKKITPQSFIPIKINNKEGHINPLSIDEIEKSFNKNINIQLINEISDSAIIVDKKNIFQSYVSLSSKPLSDAVRYAFFFNNYVEMRGYHRSSDNPIERNDEFGALFNIINTLKYALHCGFILDKKTFPYEKWLHVFAYSSPTSKSILENADNIIIELKSNKNALFGPEDKNRISHELRIIRKKLIEKAKQVGIDELWLEKWWRYISRAREIINETKWSN